MFQFNRILLIILSICTVVHAEMQDEDGNTQQDVQKEVAHYNGLRTAGFIILGTGIAGLATGIGLISSASWNSYSTPTSSGVSTKDPNGGTGMLVTVLAVPVSVVGTVFVIRGSRKSKDAKYRLQMFMGYNPFVKSLNTTIVCSF